MNRSDEVGLMYLESELDLGGVGFSLLRIQQRLLLGQLLDLRAPLLIIIIRGQRSETIEYRHMSLSMPSAMRAMPRSMVWYLWPYLHGVRLELLAQLHVLLGRCVQVVEARLPDGDLRVQARVGAERLRQTLHRLARLNNHSQ